MSDEVGKYLRDIITSKNMNVTSAAKLLGVSRPALSNLINNKAALSPEMAAKFERAFNVNAHELMNMQSANYTLTAKQRGAASMTKSFTPPFLSITADHITNWSTSISARNRMAVFLRTLINSTGIGISELDFPGNDDSQRPGWDGSIVAEEATPWIPAGISGWEFGTNKDVKPKADHDYQKSLQSTDAATAKNTTFVFVTPQRWPRKKEWEAARKAENRWKDVIVYDASDLEQWLEQSIAGQAWLANEINLPSKGVYSLDYFWCQWLADTNPPLTDMLFNPRLESASRITKEKLDAIKPIIIASDSIDEALAFLKCLFLSDTGELRSYKDQVVVFTQTGELPKLAIGNSDFIAVITQKEIELEAAPFLGNLRSILVYPRNTPNSRPDIELQPLDYHSFSVALEGMGYSRDEISRLSRESGMSLTVLRRRLSKLPAVKSPLWVANAHATKTIKCVLFAGAWNSNNVADRIILELLSDGVKYEHLEGDLAQLVSIPDSPVWFLGHSRGLVSKIDALFSLHTCLTWDDIARFLEVAEIVLTEDDPSLDLPEEQQWAAGIFGKAREISATLRNSVCESLVLLTVHGNVLFESRFNHNVENRVGNLIKKLLSPLTTRKLEAQSDNLPSYAEAAPDTLLKILEDDLDSDTPQSLQLMRPVSSGIFSRNHRTGLLWALENIAWEPKYLIRVIDLLAKLSIPEINDNWTNKPIESLHAIFRHWMPQTTAVLEVRIKSLEYLVKNHPSIAWTVCVDQFCESHKSGMYNYKPTWRNIAVGAGDPVEPAEYNAFAIRALELAIGWTHHTHKTLGDLVAAISNIPLEYVERIWDLVESWSIDASDSAKASLRELVRINMYSRRVMLYGKANKRIHNRARKVYSLLEPQDLTIRYEWLFSKIWVEESYEEFEVEPLDYRARDAYIQDLRVQALSTIMTTLGVNGVISLSEKGECSKLIGSLMLEFLIEEHDVLEFGKSVYKHPSFGESTCCSWILAGLIQKMIDTDRSALVISLLEYFEPNTTVNVLSQCTCSHQMLSIVSTLNADMQHLYWKSVNTGWVIHEHDDTLWDIISHLLNANRPASAFSCIHHRLDSVPSALLYRILDEMAQCTEEPVWQPQTDRYFISKAFETLESRKEITEDNMAMLEYQYIEILSADKAALPNLAKYLDRNPDFFSQLLAMVYKRSDGKEDPQETPTPSREVLENRARHAHYVLESFSHIPGRDENHELKYDLLLEWVEKVRHSSKELSREKVCEISLGNLLSKSHSGEDGIWPCEPVREFLQMNSTSYLEQGVKTGLFNKRGVHSRGDGGESERSIAKMYHNWAEALHYSHPRVASLLQDMADSYNQDAIFEDTQSLLRRRLGSF